MSTEPFSLIYIALAAFLSVAPVEPVEAAVNSIQSDETFAFSPEGSIKVQNINGLIEITGWDQSEVRVVTTKTGKNAQELEHAISQQKHTEDTLTIKTNIEPVSKGFLGIGRKRSSASIDYKIWAPKQSKLNEIRSVNGRVEIRDIQGPVDVETVNGPAKAEGLGSDVEISTVNGPINASLPQAPDNGSIKLETVNGRIELKLPPNVDAEIKAKAVNGSIKNEFGLSTEKKFPIGRELKGTLGNGKLDVKLKSVNGAINVRKFAD